MHYRSFKIEIQLAIAICIIELNIIKLSLLRQRDTISREISQKKREEEEEKKYTESATDRGIKIW